MGHELARAAVAAALIVGAAACGGGAAEPPSVLDNALDQVDASHTPSTGATEGRPEAGTADDAPAELPPPDPSTYEGDHRLVNLWVGADGTQTVDVWVRRTFSSGPVLVADAVAFGDVSDSFSTPPGSDVVVVGSGAGPDGPELATLPSAADGEQLTSIFTNDADGAAVARLVWEAHPDDSIGVPGPPRPGLGLVRLVAANTSTLGGPLGAGGGAFSVGDGTGECLPQRVEDDGFAPSLLAETGEVQLDLPPGAATVTLHPSSPSGCSGSPSHALTVDVRAGETTIVIVYTFDGETLDVLPLPVE